MFANIFCKKDAFLPVDGEPCDDLAGDVFGSGDFGAAVVVYAVSSLAGTFLEATAWPP